MIFAHTLDKVIEGKKWQTRRPVKVGEQFEDGRRITKLGKRTMYEIGKSYAVQPNRGKKAVARILLTGLRKERIESITDADAKAEGFSSWEDFIATWRNIHGQNADLSCEVWVFEFELCTIIDESFRTLHENRNSANRGTHNNHDVSTPVSPIPRTRMYGGDRKIR
jgi:hypothetical protein